MKSVSRRHAIEAMGHPSERILKIRAEPFWGSALLFEKSEEF